MKAMVSMFPSTCKCEKHLLAYLLTGDLANIDFQICTADKAAIKAICVSGMMDKLVSLEELVRAGTLQTPLKTQYTKTFLSEQKTKFLLQS